MIKRVSNVNNHGKTSVFKVMSIGVALLLLGGGCSDFSTLVTLPCGDARQIDVLAEHGCERNKKLYVSVRVGNETVLKEYPFMWTECSAPEDIEVSYESLWSKDSPVVGIIRLTRSPLKNGTGEPDGTHLVRFLYDFDTGEAWGEAFYGRDDSKGELLLEELQQFHPEFVLRLGRW